MPDPINVELGKDAKALTIQQGSVFARSFFVGWTDDDPAPGTRHRQPLDGYDGRGQVRKSKKLTAALLMDFTVVVSQITDVDDPDCGRVDFFAGALETAGVNHDGYCSVEVFDPLDPENVVRVFQAPVIADLDTTAP